jgi:uncharacterized protein YndB with AHSA1/START domain
MATPQSQPENSLHLKRTFAAPRERVFRAWTDVKQFGLWFHPSAEYTTIVSALDLRVGGAYSLEMHHKGGNVHKLHGTYKEVRPPEKLVFTWHVQRENAEQETLVTVEFRDLGASTEVSLLHQNFTDAQDREKHNQGWTGCLDQLRNYLA